MRKLPLLTVLLLCSFFTFTINAQVINNLFQPKNSLSGDYRRVASKYQALEINSQNLRSLHDDQPASFQLELPFENGQLKLQLKKAHITSENFSVVEALPGGQRRVIDYSAGIFYQGKIEGKTNSFATISIFKDQVMGIIADEQSNIVLGTIENNGRATNEYAMYREKDLAVPNPFSCGTSEIQVEAGPVSNPCY
ncbi:MAG TPA: hypothetical protein VF476_00950, partial [Chitinophagaceae bacterium]